MSSALRSEALMEIAAASLLLWNKPANVQCADLVISGVHMFVFMETKGPGQNWI